MPPEKVLRFMTLTDVLEEFGLETNGFSAESAEGILTRFDDDENPDDAILEAEEEAEETAA